MRLKGHAYIEALNKTIENPHEKMISLTFHSNHLSSIDDSRTSGRFLVFVPGDKIDRFYQFAIREVRSVPISNSISLISVQKKSLETNEALDRPVAYFADLWRQRDGDKFTITTRLNEAKKLENCYLCHKSALINIYPEKQRFSESLFGSHLSTVNEKISGYAKAIIAHLDTSEFGPRLGADNEKLQTDSFLKACSKGKIEVTQPSLP